MNRLLRRLGPFRSRIVLAALAATGTVAAGIGLMATAAYLIVRAGAHPPIAELALAVVGVRLFGVSRAVLRYLERLGGHDAALRLIGALRVRSFEAIQRVAPAGVEGRTSASLLIGITDDLEEIEQALIRSLLPAATSVAIIVVAGTIAWLLVPPVLPAVVIGLALTVSAAGAATVTLGRAGGRRLAPARARLASAMADLVEGRSEALAYGRSAELRKEVDDADRALTSVAARTANLSGIGSALVALGSGLALWMVVRTSVAAAASGNLDPVLLGSAALLIMVAFEPVAALPAGLSRLEGGLDAVRRVDDLERLPDPIRTTGLRPAPAADLELAGAGVADGSSGRWLLRSLDLRLRPGRRVALVGPSGAGKTTVIEVLLRFREIDSGDYRIGGVPAATVDPEAVRELIGLAQEEAPLLDETLAENMRLGKPDASDEALTEALMSVGLESFLAGLKEGLATRMGPRGAFVSGGERRRIAIARALIAERPILIVDEPTAGLDPAAARSTVATILEAARDRGLLLVTHGTDGLDEMDEIVLLGDGKVIERGTHQSLLAAGGGYARLRSTGHDTGTRPT